MVFDGGGEVLIQAKHSIGVQRPQPGWVEQDAEQLADSVLMVVRDALDQASDSGLTVCAAGLATQRSSIVCWDRLAGYALSPAISWQDRRTHRSLDALSAQDRQTVHEMTGLFVTAHYGASKLRWCRDHLDAVKMAVAQDNLCQGPLASFLVSRLTEEGCNLVDPANASRTLLWGLASMDWEPRLLDLFGVTREPLPDCVPTVYDYGMIVSGRHRIPLRVVTGDQPAALLAHGRPDADTAYINMGTGAFIQRPTGNRICDSQQLLTGIVMSTGDEILYDLECTVNGAGSALTHVEDQLGIDNLFAEQHFSQWLSQSKTPPLFLNGVSGIGSPWWVPDFESRFIAGEEGKGNGDDGEAWEKIVAVAESIVFLLQVNLTALQQCSGPLKKIMLTGGLAVSDELCQRLASLSGLPIVRPHDCEATARGTVFLLTGCPQHRADSDSGEWFQPRPDAALTGRYERWRAAMEIALGEHRIHKS